MVNTRDPIDELNITVIQQVEDLMEVRWNFEIWKTDFGAIFLLKNRFMSLKMFNNLGKIVNFLFKN